MSDPIDEPSELEPVGHYHSKKDRIFVRPIQGAYNLTEELERLRSMPRGKGGDFYLTLGARANKRFARALVTSTLEGRTSFTETFRLLGVKKMATFAKLGKSLGVGS